jgi:hypothetical protein
MEEDRSKLLSQPGESVDHPKVQYGAMFDGHNSDAFRIDFELLSSSFVSGRGMRTELVSFSCFGGDDPALSASAWHSGKREEFDLLEVGTGKKLGKGVRGFMPLAGSTNLKSEFSYRTSEFLTEWTKVTILAAVKSYNVVAQLQRDAMLGSDLLSDLLPPGS